MHNHHPGYRLVIYFEHVVGNDWLVVDEKGSSVIGYGCEIIVSGTRSLDHSLPSD